MSLWDEIAVAKDPLAGFESSGKPPHEDSLGDSEQAGWCHLADEEQHNRRDVAAFRVKLIWHCKQELEKGRARHSIESYFRYYIRHFDWYRSLIGRYPIYRGERGKDIIHEYMTACKTDPACVFDQFIEMIYEREFGRPGLAKTGLPSFFDDLTKPMMLPELLNDR